MALEYQKAVERKTYTDCEAMSFYVDFMVGNAEPGLLVDSLRVFFEENRGGFLDGVLLQAQGRPSGYKARYQNNYPVRPANDRSRAADQGHHFAFFFVLGSALADLAAGDAAIAITASSYGLEAVHNETPGNLGDANLGIAAGMLGYFSRTTGPGATPANQLGAKIREELCEKRR